MALHGRGWIPSALAGAGLVGAGLLMPASASASATVTCPTVASGTGVVTPAPSAGVDWAGCDLANALMSGADLAGAQLQYANLSSADVENADLVNVDFDGANLFNAEVGGDAAGATFTSATLTDTFLTDTNLESADLSGISGSGVKFIGSDLKDANLQDADVDYGDLSSADLFGATLTGLSDTSTMWTNATCPNGASANYYTDGCVSPVAVTTPSATPVVTAGTPGNNGWYTSAVTVTWYWIDSNDLIPAQCPASTTSTGQGADVVVSASCTDAADNVGQGSVPLQIDTTPPVQRLTGFRDGAVYLAGRTPSPACRTTDAVSGVARNGIATISSSRPDGTGINTVTCSGGQDNAGNVAATVTGHYTVVYEFGGFITPKVGSVIKIKTKTIVVRFRLAFLDGTPIGVRPESVLARRHDVAATLRGPGISPVVSTCSWNRRAKYLSCPIALPPGIKVGKHRHYTITATENLGSGFVKVPADAFSENPEPVSFSS
jgi:uncharacterized protein YjbI with pentapeptide repeats